MTGDKNVQNTVKSATKNSGNRLSRSQRRKNSDRNRIEATEAESGIHQTPFMGYESQGINSQGGHEGNTGVVTS